MAAPNTSTYILVNPDSADLPNSSVLAASGGLTIDYSGPMNPITVTTIPNGNLDKINQFAGAGFVVYDSSIPGFIPKTFTAGTGIGITNPDGQTGDTLFSVIENTTLQQVQVQNNGVFAGQAAAINFVPGANTSITAGFDPLLGRTNVTIGTSTSFAPDTATYILQTPDSGDLPNSQALSTLAAIPGEKIVSVSTLGVLSTAVANVDYQLPSQNLIDINSASPLPLGAILSGTGVGIGAVTIGPAGTVLTSDGTSFDWNVGAEGFNIVILPTSTIAVTPANKTIYVPTSPSANVIFTLPVGTPGEIFEIKGWGSGISGWEIHQSVVGQSIQFGGFLTTLGMTGRLFSSNPSDSITIICVSANQFIATDPFGYINVV